MQYVGFLAFSFVGLTLINRIMEGAFLSGADVGVMNNLLIFRSFDVGGFFSVPVLNVSYFTEGLVNLVQWDYTFFGGTAQILMFFLYSLGMGLSFLLFTLAIGMLYNFFTRVR